MFFRVHNAVGVALIVSHTAVLYRNSGKEPNLSAHQHTSISGAVNSKKSVNLKFEFEFRSVPSFRLLGFLQYTVINSGIWDRSLIQYTLHT